MFCPKCGAQNPDGTRFCAKCGEQISAAPAKVALRTPSGVSNPVQPRKDNRQLIAIIAGALAVILLFSLVFGGRGYKKTVRNFMDSFVDLKAKGMVEMLPDKVVEQALEDMGYGKRDIKILIGELQDELNYAMQYLQMLTEYDLDYRIVGAEDVSKEELEYIKLRYSDIGLKVSKAKLVNVELSVEIMGVPETTDVEIMVVKIGRSWYIDADSIGNIL